MSSLLASLEFVLLLFGLFPIFVRSSSPSVMACLRLLRPAFKGSESLFLLAPEMLPIFSL